LWIVNLDTKKIDFSTWIYWKKSIWFRSVSENELSNIKVNKDIIKDYIFYRDRIITDLYIWRFDVKIFNTNIYDLELNITNELRELFIWKKINELPSNIYNKFNINF
jgi:hypothetical protein